jgi:hypothetical protein
MGRFDLNDWIDRDVNFRLQLLIVKNGQVIPEILAGYAVPFLTIPNAVYDKYL